MIGLCLGLAGVIWAQVPVTQFTLAWNHTVEKIRWEEDYQVTASGLLPGEARVRGTGAGMEIPDDAVLANGSWHYRNRTPLLPVLRAGRAPEGGDYQICGEAIGCHPMADWLGPPNHAQPAVELWSCEIDTAVATGPAATK